MILQEREEEHGGREDNSVRAERESFEEDPISRHIAEAIAYGRYTASAWADGMRVRVRNGLVLTVAAIAALPVVLIALGVAVYLFMQGLSAGLAAWTGWPAWAGELIIGGSVLLVAAGGVGFGIHRMKAHSRKQTVEEYEHSLAEQQDAFGADAHQRAASEE
jgi:hypothetical protein